MSFTKLVQCYLESQSKLKDSIIKRIRVVSAAQEPGKQRTRDEIGEISQSA